MHVFRVVREPFGWAVRIGEAMTAPFWSRSLAIQEAQCLCEALRRHGEIAEVVVEPLETGEAPRPLQDADRRRLEGWARDARL